MGIFVLGINKVSIISIDVVVMYYLDIFTLVKNQFHISQKQLSEKQAIIYQYIIDTNHFGGYIHTAELQILIILVWVRGN